MIEGEPDRDDVLKPLPPKEHEKAEAERLKKLKESHAGSHQTAGTTNLPKVHSDDV